jgi:branched-chain amino acid aminotransferase
MKFSQNNKDIGKLFPNTIVNINGELLSPENANISIFDRGFLYGDSVYEVTLTQDNVPLYLNEHLDRLWNSASLISMEILIDRGYLLEQIKRTLDPITSKRKYIRIIVTRGESEISLAPSTISNNLIIICKELPDNPTWWYEKGVEFIVSGVVRNSPDSLNPNAKSGNYLNSVMAHLEAKKKGAYDSVMVNKQGEITEGTTNNIWMVKDDKIVTPPLKVGILKGITRDKTIEICKDNKLNFSEEVFTPVELFACDECFFTSSTKGIVPIVKLDDQIIGKGKPGEVTKNLINLYKKKLNEYVQKNINNFN